MIKALEHPAIRDFLLTRGSAYVISFEKETEGRQPVNIGPYSKRSIQWVDVTLAQAFSRLLPDELGRHVADSGFPDVIDWVAALLPFTETRTARKVYVYCVRMLPVDVAREALHAERTELRIDKQRPIEREADIDCRDNQGILLYQAANEYREFHFDCAGKLLLEACQETRNISIQFRALAQLNRWLTGQLRQCQYDNASALASEVNDLRASGLAPLCRALHAQCCVAYHQSVGMAHWASADIAVAQKHLLRATDLARTAHISPHGFLERPPTQQDPSTHYDMVKWACGLDLKIRLACSEETFAGFRGRVRRLMESAEMQEPPPCLCFVWELVLGLQKCVRALSKLAEQGVQKSEGSGEIVFGFEEFEEIRRDWLLCRFSLRVAAIDRMLECGRDMMELSDPYWKVKLTNVRKFDGTKKWEFDHAELATEQADRWMAKFREAARIDIPQEHETKDVPLVDDSGTDFALTFEVVIEQYRDKKGLMRIAQKGSDKKWQIKLDRVETEMCLALAREMKATEGQQISRENRGWVTYTRFKQSVTGWNAVTPDNRIHRKISSIRKKLPVEQLPGMQIIEKRTKLGYRLAIPPRAIRIRTPESET